MAIWDGQDLDEKSHRHHSALAGISPFKGTRIDLLHGLGDAWTENGAHRTGAALSRATGAGERIVLCPA